MPPGTVDGVDIAARDAVLTSTTTTANAALPKTGGTMTGQLAVTHNGGTLNLVGTDHTYIQWYPAGIGEVDMLILDLAEVELIILL